MAYSSVPIASVGCREPADGGAFFNESVFTAAAEETNINRYE